MKPELFKELLASVREAGAVMRGERKAHRQSKMEMPDVKTILKELGLKRAVRSVVGVRQSRSATGGKTTRGWRDLCSLRIAEKHPEALLDTVMT